MLKRSMILLSGLFLGSSAFGALRFGLANAVARRSAQLVNKAGDLQSQSQAASSLICGGHTTGLTGPATLSAAPIDLANITFLESLGNLNPPGHTFPTDHVYFYYTNLNLGLNVNPITSPAPGQCSSGCPVYAPADGFINSIQFTTDFGGVANQYKVTFVHTDTFSSYYDHLSSLAPSILAQTGPITPFGSTCVWVPVKAGDVIGSVGTVGGEHAVDLGVYNLQVTQPFITPSHYNFSANADSPYKYFQEPLRTTLYGMISRQTPDYLGSNEKDGIMCFDVPNAVSGNWAAQGSDSYWLNPDSWPQQLSIGYDPVYASQIRITFGGKNGSQSFGLVGSWPVQPGATAPANVTEATGPYGYQIYVWDPSYGTVALGSGPLGLLMLQLIDNHTLKAEYFSGSSATSLPFDSNAVFYTR